MRAKNIDKHLRKVFNEWIASIQDEVVRNLAEQNAFITGGCIVSLILGEKVNDYDVYFKSVFAAQAVAEYYVAKFQETSRVLKDGVTMPIRVEADESANRVRVIVKSAGIASEGEEDDYTYFEQTSGDEAENYVDRQFKVIQREEREPPEDFIDRVVKAEEEARESVDRTSTDENEKFRPVFITSNSITLSDKIQLIIRFIGTPKRVHENFDFVHVTNYWLPGDGLHLNKNALASIATKELKVINNGSKYPICTLFRLRKFIARGWIITAGQILKIALQISDLDLEDPIVLEDQLIGVDVAYFNELLDIVKKKQDGMDSETENDEDVKKVDRAYLLEIIDRLF